MAEIEEETGVRSTYFLMLRSAMYNLVCIPNLELVRQIIRRGHEIGVHFDEQACPNLNATRIAKCVDWERALLSREFGVKVNVASFHQPSQRVLDNCIKLNCINTNDRGDMRGVYYISYSNTVWKEGVGARYSSTWAGFCPSERFLRRQHSRVQLLTHPEWWTQEEMTVRQKWNQMLRNNFELIQASLLGREKTYTERHEMAFT
jgi:hypothetical protein